MDSLLHRLNQWASDRPGDIAQRYKIRSSSSPKSSTPWTDISVLEFRNRVHYLALFLESKGVQAGDSGCIYSYNMPQWVHLELALTSLNAMSGGIYPNSIQNDIQYIIKNMQSKVLGVQDKKYFSKIGEIPDFVELIIVFDDDTSFHPKAVSYSKALEEGKFLSKQKSFQALIDQAKIDIPAYLIFTSGTTGEPKGAMLSQDNLAFASDMIIKHWEIDLGKGNLFSFLPLCHIAEKIQNLGVGLTGRLPVSFCTKIEAVTVELTDVQPALLLCVPRVWEKIMEGVEAKLSKTKGIKKQLAKLAFKVGEKIAQAKYSKKPINLFDSFIFKILDKIILSKIREATGLKNIQRAASGAAALPAQVQDWYASMGIEILQAFGLTETSAAGCMTERGVKSSGTVGVPTVGTEVKIAEDDEILMRGRHIFLGYLKKPEETALSIDRDGWLHTGDLGKTGENGLIKIIGRKKEIMKSSGGKMVAPVPIEEQIKTHSHISQVCIVGDGRKYFTAIITLTELVYSKLKMIFIEDMKVIDSDLIQTIKKHMDEVNQKLASYEKVKYFTILSRDFSIDEGEMTPTMKMKRNVIEKKYKELIDSMYREA